MKGTSRLAARIAYRGEVRKREVGRYRQDERGIVHRLARGERA